ncbi:thioredoxin reductase [Eggerthella sp. CAG:1427]|nr:thioredoxin reductase [Eggerthella sp. CAG:1427]
MDNSKEQLATDALFIAVGTQPDTAWLSDVVELDPSGYVVTYKEGATSTVGVFAAGDTRTTPLRQVVTAVSDGALAAEAAAKYIASW